MPPVPTGTDLLASLDRVEAMVAAGAVPAPVASRVRRVDQVVRDTIPRLASLGAGSPQACSVMATATDYLPEAVAATCGCLGSSPTPARSTGESPR